MNKKVLLIFILFLLLLTTGAGCKKQTVEEATKPVTLNYWRVFDGQDDFAEIIQRYNAQHPYVTINYRKLRYDEYEEALLNAFAEDRGPDIFSIHNTWMRKYESKLEPLPSQTTMIYQVSQGTIKKELVAEKRVIPSINLKELKQNFVDVVYSDVVINNKIYGLPLSVDTLAMYYNQDLLDASGVVEVPQYWNNDFQQTVKKITKLDLKGNILQSGVALGTARNIERFSDILSVLMIQNGAIMMSDSGQILFNTVPANSQNKNYNPGQMALRFYNDFADPVKEVYSWNTDFPNSIDAFASGQVAIIFAYSYHLPIIKSKAPKLNFLIAPLPQIEGSISPINFANYWVEVVSKKSKYKNEAWNFIQYMTRAEQAKTYLDKTKKPTALRSLISEQKKDLDLEVFADQVLTARSWYKGKNPILMEGFFSEMVEKSLEDTEGKGMEIMNLYANRIQQTIR
ncbi:MAG: ABC transporter substrate-binding protein [Patescibacteria group bacterium]|jgi:ABC-type glycerol-3-phosphate transport system substrate-binding protein